MLSKLSAFLNMLYAIIGVVSVQLLFCVAAHAQNTADDPIKNGIVKARQQDYKGAIQDFSKEIKLHPDSVHAYIYRAYAKEAISNYKEAIEDYDKAIMLKPGNAQIYYDRALSKYSSGDLRNACLDWKKSVDLGLPDAVYMLKQYCK